LQQLSEAFQCGLHKTDPYSVAVAFLPLGGIDSSLPFLKHNTCPGPAGFVLYESLMHRRRLFDVGIIFDRAGFLIAGKMLYKIPGNPRILRIERVNKMFSMI
jgi:hypothetical protein